MSRIVYLLNGPNLNLLGKRQPTIYGYETLADVEAECRRIGTEPKLEIEFRQSNSEFQIIDWIHEARERAGALSSTQQLILIRPLLSSTRSTPVSFRSSRCISRTFTSARPSGITPMSHSWRLA